MVLLTYSAGAVLAWLLVGATEGPPFFYPSAGVTVALMMLTWRRLWPAVVAAIIVGELLVGIAYGTTQWVVFWYAAANVVEPLVGASLVLAWCHGTPDLSVRRHLVIFSVFACIAAPIAGGLIGGSAAAVHDARPWFYAVYQWWAGNALGVLVMAVPILLWRRQGQLLRARPLEAAVIVGLVAAVSSVGFWNSTPPAVMVLPFLGWAAVRLGMFGAALVGAVVAWVANFATSRGHGIFINLNVGVRVALAQILAGIIVLGGLLIAQEATARINAVRERKDERRERLRLESLAELARGLSAALTPQEIGAELAARVIGSSRATALALGVLDPGRTGLRWVVMEGYTQESVDRIPGVVALSDSPVSTEVDNVGQPVLIRDSAEYAGRYKQRRWSTFTGAEAVAVWPLESGGERIGLLMVTWSGPQPLTEAEKAYLSAIATMAAQALARSRLYADEHARAAILQAAVLPNAAVGVNGLDFGVAYEPADIVHGLGGDWYDVMLLPGNRIYIAVGDVVGHGLPAVQDMAQLRNAGRALAHQGLSPAKLLRELNGFARQLTMGKFATMVVAMFEPADRSLSYCAAGHPPPILRRSSDGEVSWLSKPGGPVLGPVPDAGYTEATVHVAPGDILVLYTDGLVERPGMDIETGLARVRQIVAGWDSDRPLSSYCHELQQRLSPPPRVDDVCIIAARVQ